MVPSWYEDAPEKNRLGTLKLKGKRHHLVSAYRCVQCGHLDLFAL